MHGESATDVAVIRCHGFVAANLVLYARLIALLVDEGILPEGERVRAAQAAIRDAMRTRFAAASRYPGYGRRFNH
jgi:hypothetical protein